MPHPKKSDTGWGNHRQRMQSENPGSASSKEEGEITDEEIHEAPPTPPSGWRQVLFSGLHYSLCRTTFSMKRLISSKEVETSLTLPCFACIMVSATMCLHLWEGLGLLAHGLQAILHLADTLLITHPTNLGQLQGNTTL